MLLSLMNLSLAADLSYDQAKANSDRDEASLSQALTQKLVESQAKVMGDILPGCMVSIPHPNGHADLTPFTVVMQLDASGKVVRTWLHGTTPLAVCFHRGVISKTLFNPPKAPFYTSIELALKEKDSGN
jgi:hypothetical protein